MKHGRKIIALFALAILPACQDQGGGDEGSDLAGDGKTGTSVEPSRRHQDGEGGTTRLRSQDDQITKWIEELETLEGAEARRELFGDILVELPPDEHNLALSLVVRDLNSRQSSNLLSEYLELTSFMSPTIQLPGMARLLEEPRLTTIQRAAMEQQLRDELGLTPDEPVDDWRPLIEAHLRKIPGVIPE